MRRCLASPPASAPGQPSPQFCGWAWHHMMVTMNCLYCSCSQHTAFCKVITHTRSAKNFVYCVCVFLPKNVQNTNTIYKHTLILFIESQLGHEGTLGNHPTATISPSQSSSSSLCTDHNTVLWNIPLANLDQLAWPCSLLPSCASPPLGNCKVLDWG